jgi:hypothetical protein
MTTRRKIAILGLGVIAAAIPLALAAALLERDNAEPGAAPSSSGSTVSESPVEPYVIRLSGFLVPLSPEELVYRADGAFEGDVVSISPARWSTPSGAPPAGWSPGQRLPQPEVIYRSVTIRVTSRMYGDGASTMNVAVLGGSVGAVAMPVEGSLAPEFAVGDHVVLFVMKPAEGWRLGSDNLGLLQGYVVKEGEAATPELPPIRFTELAERGARRASPAGAGSSATSGLTRSWGVGLIVLRVSACGPDRRSPHVTCQSSPHITRPSLRATPCEAVFSHEVL